MSASLRNLWPQVVGQAWADAEFRSNLLADPEHTLMQLGIDVPQGHQIRVFEDVPGQTHLVVPLPPPSLGDLAQLDSTSVSPQEKGVHATEELQTCTHCAESELETCTHCAESELQTCTHCAESELETCTHCAESEP